MGVSTFLGLTGIPGLAIRLFQRLKRSDPSSGSDQKCVAYKHIFLDYLQLFCALQLNLAYKIIVRIVNEPSTKYDFDARTKLS